MFPEVHYTHYLERRIVSEVTQRFLCVLQDSNNNGPPVIATKNIAGIDDHDVDFTLHFYTPAQLDATKMVMIEHNSTGLYLAMSEQKTLVLRPLGDDNRHPNIVDLADDDDPEQITTADSRFFYIRTAGPGLNSYVIRATNGVDNNLYLSTSDNGEELTLKAFNGTHYSAEMRFVLRPL